MAKGIFMDKEEVLKRFQFLKKDYWRYLPLTSGVPDDDVPQKPVEENGTSPQNEGSGKNVSA